MHYIIIHNQREKRMIPDVSSVCSFWKSPRDLHFLTETQQIANIGYHPKLVPWTKGRNVLRNLILQASFLLHVIGLFQWKWLYLDFRRVCLATRSLWRDKDILIVIIKGQTDCPYPDSLIDIYYWGVNLLFAVPMGCLYWGNMDTWNDFCLRNKQHDIGFWETYVTYGLPFLRDKWVAPFEVVQQWTESGSLRALCVPPETRGTRGQDSCLHLLLSDIRVALLEGRNAWAALLEGQNGLPFLRDIWVALFEGLMGCPFEGQMGCPLWGTYGLPLLEGHMGCPFWGTYGLPFLTVVKLFI